MKVDSVLQLSKDKVGITTRIQHTLAEKAIQEELGEGVDAEVGDDGPGAAQRLAERSENEQVPPDIHQLVPNVFVYDLFVDNPKWAKFYVYSRLADYKELWLKYEASTTCRQRWVNSPHRAWIYNTLSHPECSTLAFCIGIFMICIILLNTITFCIESVPYYERVDTEVYYALIIVDYVCVGIFTVEFIMRILTCPDLKAFCMGFFNWLDLIAILPFYIELMVTQGDSDAATQARIVRLLRILRVLRLFKAFGKFQNLTIVMATMKASADVLSMLALLLLVLLVVCATIFYYIEPATFDSIPQAIYFSQITLTTTGYGDIYPVTPWGKFFAGVTMLTCMVIVSCPIAVLGGNFATRYSDYMSFQAAVSRSRKVWPTFCRLRKALISHEQPLDNLIDALRESQFFLDRELKAVTLQVALAKAELDRARAMTLRSRSKLRMAIMPSISGISNMARWVSRKLSNTMTRNSSMAGSQARGGSLLPGGSTLTGIREGRQMSNRPSSLAPKPSQLGLAIQAASGADGSNAPRAEANGADDALASTSAQARPHAVLARMPPGRADSLRRAVASMSPKKRDEGSQPSSPWHAADGTLRDASVSVSLNATPADSVTEAAHGLPVRMPMPAAPEELGTPRTAAPHVRARQRWHRAVMMLVEAERQRVHALADAVMAHAKELQRQASQAAGDAAQAGSTPIAVAGRAVLPSPFGNGPGTGTAFAHGAGIGEAPSQGAAPPAAGGLGPAATAPMGLMGTQNSYASSLSLAPAPASVTYSMNTFMRAANAMSAIAVTSEAKRCLEAGEKAMERARRVWEGQRTLLSLVHLLQCNDVPGKLERMVDRNDMLHCWHEEGGALAGGMKQLLEGLDGLAEILEADVAPPPRASGLGAAAGARTSGTGMDPSVSRLSRGLQRASNAGTDSQSAVSSLKPTTGSTFTLASLADSYGEAIQLDDAQAPPRARFMELRLAAAKKASIPLMKVPEPKPPRPPLRERVQQFTSIAWAKVAGPSRLRAPEQQDQPHQHVALAVQQQLSISLRAGVEQRQSLADPEAPTAQP